MAISAPSDIREILERLPLKQRLGRARRWRDRDGDSIAAGATRQALRELALHIQLPDAQAERTEAELDVLTDLAALALRDIVGVGIHTAAGRSATRLHPGYR